MPVAIVGMHRSGTSMVAQLLGRCGIYLGEDGALLGPTADNRQGHWEHAGFHRLNEEILAELGGGWDMPPRVPTGWGEDIRLRGARTAAEALVESFDGREPWGWKDPRTSLTLPLWQELIPDLKLVWCLRHPLEVALSLQRRGMFSYANSLTLWRIYNERVMSGLEDGNWILTEYDAYFERPESELRRLLSHLEIPYSQSSITEAVAVPANGLRHSRFAPDALANASVAAEIVELYETLRSLASSAVASGVAPVSSTGHRGQRVVDERAVEVLAQRMEPEDGDGAPGPAQGHYTRQVRALAALIERRTAAGARVLVVSNGDPALVRLRGRSGSHFPQLSDGRPAGHHPASGLAAIAHLEALRAAGADYLALPECYAWWLDHYPELHRHLATRYQLVELDSESGRLFSLTAMQDWLCRCRNEVADVVAAARSQVGQSPTVVDWGSGLDLADVLPEASGFSWEPDAGYLPFADRSVDVVVAAAESGRRREVERVARIAGLLVPPRGEEPPDGVVRVQPPGAAELLADVSIVAVLGGAEGQNKRFLRSLSETLPERFEGEIVLVHPRPEASPPVEMFTGRWPARLQSSDPAGLLASIRQAAARCHGELMVVADAGALLLPGWLRPLVDTFRRTEDAGAVCSRCVGADGSLRAAGGSGRGDEATSLGEGLVDPGAAPHSFLQRVDFCTGGVLATRRRLLVELPAQERIPPQSLLEYCAALRRYGLSSYCQPGSVIVDVGDDSALQAA